MKQVLKTRKDVAFYLFMYPLPSHYPSAYDKSKAIMCAKSTEAGLAMLDDAYMEKLPGMLDNERVKQLLSEGALADAKALVASGRPRRTEWPGCDTKVVDDNVELARGLGISGTPAMIFSSGVQISGTRQASDIIGILNSLK